MPVPHVSQWFAPVIGAIKKWFQADSYKADSVSPALILDFANNRYAANSSAKNFSDILTFTRGSTGTYFNSSGVMQTSAADVPRFDCDPATGVAKGLLVEGARTNLVRYSNGSGGATSNSYGGVTATKVRQETRNGVSGSVITISGTASFSSGFAVSLTTSGEITTTTGHTFTLSAYTEVIEDRGANRPIVNLGVRSLNGSTQVDFDRVFSNLQTISGFARSSGTATTDQATTTGIQAAVEVAFSSGHTYDFDIWVGGVQTEEAGFASSLIPTSGSAVTRSADLVSNSASNTVPFADWYNQSEGTVVAKFKGIGGDDNYPRVYEISDGTTGNRQTINLAPTTRNITLAIFNGGVFQASRDSGISGLAAATAALAYKINNFAFSVNGDAPTTDTSGTPPTVTKLNIGSRYYNGEIFFGTIKELLFYPIRVTNSEMQRITT